MRNRNLLDAVESYLVCLKKHMEQPTGDNFAQLQSAERKLTPIVAIESNMEDIKEMFSDLRDYWDTLEISK
ncbi:hypothetical protein M2451_002634 [Dysgonomonas sp. PFB1-18]|uniref:hypothetical protein n=1 Tax=unclassified Dysgonomonas TaxID=2630389 RepID=UPI002475EAB0|nr:MULTISPECIES: hypothetical protein [unclassified Dysgonomonas]MDH6308115.1 hypothetical protein [Dysgonomonas sp. PF1-14]MDH6339654.1 hypothetical protein [Dysgonomonas sp. PF1-16]MDH6381305.1 hypothetical protein [Dysgonomonas sp. PFB1-18]MDH6398517.1 hypothetical protein [Dysgonomonas sp. PF1-23]